MGKKKNLAAEEKQNRANEEFYGKWNKEVQNHAYIEISSHDFAHTTNHMAQAFVNSFGGGCKSAFMCAYRAYVSVLLNTNTVQDFGNLARPIPIIVWNAGVGDPSMMKSPFHSMFGKAIEQIEQDCNIKLIFTKPGSGMAQHIRELCIAEGVGIHLYDEMELFMCVFEFEKNKKNLARFLEMFNGGSVSRSYVLFFSDMYIFKMYTLYNCVYYTCRFGE